jgi:CheY-like chemotaxis protein
MGGRISLRSAPGRGTQVSLWLPSPAPASTGPDAVPGPPAETAADPTGDTPDTSSDRETRPVVLVVDDEDGVRIGTKRLLERAGYDVLDATSALDALARHAATRIDVLLTDMVMPGGKSGLDLANALRHARPGLPVIYMSGYSSDAIGNGGVIEPGVPLLEKPFTRDQLLVVLDDVLTHSLG